MALILIPSLVDYIGKANESKNLANARSVYSEAVLQHTTGTAFTNNDPFKGCVVTVENNVVTKVTCTIDGKAYVAPDPSVTGAQ